MGKKFKLKIHKFKLKNKISYNKIILMLNKYKFYKIN